MTKKISPLKSAPSSILKKIKVVCSDIDDTITTKGKLTENGYRALWKLKNNGIKIVLTTGRPAGHCDHLVRFWPVDAVIGENGAFIFFIKDGVRTRLDILKDKEKKNVRKKIEKLKKSIKKKFPETKWASDQNYREYDLAIDLYEDVPPWSNDKIKTLIKFIKKKGANCKLSSIHLNAWFGDYDKQKAIKFWLNNDAPGLSGGAPTMDQLLYLGDSPNDGPAFSFFKYSIGVANLNRFIDQLNDFPTWITQNESGDGVLEIANLLTAQ